MLKNYVKCVYLQYHNVPYKAPLTYMSYKHIFSYTACTKTKRMDPITNKSNCRVDMNQAQIL